MRGSLWEGWLCSGRLQSEASLQISWQSWSLLSQDYAEEWVTLSIKTLARLVVFTTLTNTTQTTSSSPLQLTTRYASFEVVATSTRPWTQCLRAPSWISTAPSRWAVWSSSTASATPRTAATLWAVCPLASSHTYFHWLLLQWLLF